MRKFLLKVAIYTILVSLSFLVSPTTIFAECRANPPSCISPNQSCTIQGVVYCCTTSAECQAPAQNQTGQFDSFTQGLNLTIFQGSPNAIALSTPRGIISALLPYLFTLGGLILLVMIVWGGFEMLTGAANPKSQEAGKQRITAAVIGFILLFASYWLAQLVEVIFGVSIL